MMPTPTGRPFDTKVLLNQIGRMNVLAISGGRVTSVTDADGYVVRVELPVSYGYRVAVELGWDDLYTVKREFVRGDKVFEKGYVEGVFCDDVGEVAYKASCYLDEGFGERE